MEASTTRGTTALVYCLINSSLYTGTVHRWWSTSNWPDGHQGCSQLSTGLLPSYGLGWEEKSSEVQPLRQCPLMIRYRRGGTGEEEGGETSRPENETHLVAARPPGREPGSLPRRHGLPGVVCECTKVQCTIQMVQPDRGHHFGSKHNKRYDSIGLLSDK